MRKILFFFIYIISINAYSSEFVCSFEEVYSDGSMQQGRVLIKNDLIRYQYQDPQLFTIIHNTNTYAVRNNDHSVVQKIDLKFELLQALIKIFLDDIKSNTQYIDQDLNILLEKSLNFNFYKRISIMNKKVNLSIYFNDCRDEILSKNLFYQNPFLKYQF